MSMRMSISQAAMVVLAGCGVTATTEYTATDQAVLAAMATGPAGEALAIVRCPDPKTDCTHSNGSGVFFEEHGDAGINAPWGNIMFMITAFTNHDSTVAFRGRYAAVWLRGMPWLWADGTIDSADYGTAHGLQVVNVSEEHTIPTWRLVDPRAPWMPMLVTDHELLALKLHVTLNVPSPAFTPVHVLLDFDQWDVIPDRDPDGGIFYGHPVLHAYNLRWRPEGAPPSSATQYCVRGPGGRGSGAPDQVVFQRGISVDPVTGTVGTVTPDSSVVTMSCAWGAVAKAYNWGYAYVDLHDGDVFNLSYYRAAIHMKRASYCGDENFYTDDGMRIGILDNFPTPINIPPPDFVLEAQWSPQGATCVNVDNLRILGSFDGQCPPRPRLLPCSPRREPTYLEDYTPRRPPALPTGS